MVCILAMSKVWKKELHENLQKRTSKDFISVHSPEELSLDFLRQIKPEYIFFPHWSFIIPSYIFNNFECIVFHMTDLPFGRGGSPLQNLISRGIYHTQISALRCQEGIDTGHIYLKKPLSLLGRAQDIYQHATTIIEDMIIEIINKKISPTPQSGDVVAFKRRKPEEGNLAGLNNITKIYDYIRMLDADGYPNAFIETDNLILEFTNAAVKEDKIEANVRIKLKGFQNA